MRSANFGTHSYFITHGRRQPRQISPSRSAQRRSTAPPHSGPISKEVRCRLRGGPAFALGFPRDARTRFSNGDRLNTPRSGAARRFPQRSAPPRTTSRLDRVGRTTARSLSTWATAPRLQLSGAPTRAPEYPTPTKTPIGLPMGVSSFLGPDSKLSIYGAYLAV